MINRRHLLLLTAAAPLVASFLALASVAQQPPTHPATEGKSDVADSPGPLRGVESFHRLNGHAGRDIIFYSFSPDGRRLVSSSRQDRSLGIWDGSSGREVCVLRDPDDKMLGTFPSLAAISADGRRLASSGPATRRQVGELLRVQSVYEGATVKVWDVATGRLIRILGGFDGHALGVALSRDGSVVTACDEGLNFKSWESDTGREVASHKGSTRGKAYHPSGYEWASCNGSRFAIVSTLDRTSLPDYLYCCDVSNGKERMISPLRQGTAHFFGKVAFSGDGQRIVAMSYGLDSVGKLVKRELVEFDFESGSEVRRVPLPSGGLVSSMVLSPDDRFVVVGGSDGRVSVFHRGSGDRIQTIDRQGAGAIRLIGFTGRGMRILSGGEVGLMVRMDGSEAGLKIWDVAVSFDP